MVISEAELKFLCYVKNVATINLSGSIKDELYKHEYILQNRTNYKSL